MTNDEGVAFDHGYKLGFRAGQLDGRRYALAVIRHSYAVYAGENIARTRGNISLKEYERIIESHNEEASHEANRHRL